MYLTGYPCRALDYIKLKIRMVIWVRFAAVACLEKGVPDHALACY